MGDLEDFYRKKDKEREDEKTKYLVSKHNHEIDLIKELVEKIVKRIEIQLPTQCDWLECKTIGEKEFVCWHFFHEGNSEQDFFILPDGRIFFCKDYNSYIKKEQDCVFFQLNHKDHTNIHAAQIHPNCLGHLRASLAREARDTFGAEVGDYWR